MTAPSVRLTRGPERSAWVDAFVAEQGGRVGLDGVLDDLDRSAVRVKAPVPAATYGFRWDRRDGWDREWYPQGITTSADAGDDDVAAPRRVVVVSWYGKKARRRPSRGVRLSVVDITSPDAPRYRHVLLVQLAQDPATGRVSVQPVRIHAGGIVWRGRSLLVADTGHGVRTFRLDDLVRVGGDGYDGHRYLLPQHGSYRAAAVEGAERFRFSFLSLDRGHDTHRLLAGEYGRGEKATRLVTFDFASVGADDELALVDAAACPQALEAGRLTHMQGAVVVDGTYYISTSRGARHGRLWTRSPGGAAVEHSSSLAVGPEDLSYWPQRDELWNLSEHPGRRLVYAIPRAAFPHP